MNYLLSLVPRASAHTDWRETLGNFSWMTVTAGMIEYLFRLVKNELCGRNNGAAQFLTAARSSDMGEAFCPDIITHIDVAYDAITHSTLHT